MITPVRWRSVLEVGLAIVMVCGQGVAAAETFGEAWKLSTPSVWPPAVIDGKVVLKNGDTLVAHSVADGRQLWTKKLKALRYGAGVLDGGPRHVYVLGGDALYLLDPADGKVTKRKPLQSPSYVHYHDGSVYVVAKSGVLRFDEAGQKLISKAKGYGGEIRGADGDYVVLYDHSADAKRLIVVDLKKGKKTYEFKLLPEGWHRVVKVRKGRVVFLDFSKRRSDGTNPRKLYFTEADYVRSKKVKDQALHKRYPATYGASACDHFWATTDDSGIVFIGNHGSAGEPSNLIAYDPGQDKLLWSRSGAVVNMGLLLHRGELWTGVADQEGNAHAVAYSPDDGSQIARLPLDGAGTGVPVAAGARVLIRTRGSVYCFAPKKGAVAPPQVGAGGVASGKGWRQYRDRTAGYLLRTPKTWRFERSKLVKMGGLRMSIPFFRVDPAGGKFLGSVHVLTWEAAGRDVNQLWNSVYTQRRQTNPDVRVVSVHKENNVGGTGLTGIKATYTFRRKGYPEQLRSLCVVSHGVAFELRGWAGPGRPEEVWREIEGIFATFQPHKF